MIVYEVATNPNPNSPKRSFRVDRYTEAPRSILEDILSSIEGVSVVERQRVDALLQEAEFGRLSGLVDTEKAIKLGKLLGANFILMGSIQDVTSTTRQFSGYGIQTRNTVVRSAVRLRLVDIASGKVTYSKVTRGTAAFDASSFGGVTNSDVAYSVIEAALEQLRDDDGFKENIRGGRRLSGSRSEPVRAATRAGEVEVEFAPKPENSDVEIDGRYVGGSPLKRSFPAGAEIKIKISKAGHKPWEGRILVEPGLRITKELERNEP
jgi:hypothetical protein